MIIILQYAGEQPYEGDLDDLLATDEGLRADEAAIRDALDHWGTYVGGGGGASPPFTITRLLKPTEAAHTDIGLANAEINMLRRCMAIVGEEQIATLDTVHGFGIPEITIAALPSAVDARSGSMPSRPRSWRRDGRRAR